MSVPPEILKMMQQQRVSAEAGAPPSGAQPQGFPKAAGMVTPQKKAGNEGKGKVMVHIALKMLQQALVIFGSESEEGQAILPSLTKLGKKFGGMDGDDLIPTQIMEMARNEPSMGGGSQIMKQMQAGAMAGSAPQPAQARPQPPMMR